MQPITKRIFGLDLMRSVAILMVLCSHVLWIYPKKPNVISQLFSLFGFWGVEMFFVLSGFLIGKILYTTYITENFTIQSVFYFLKRRWFRTLPNYYLVLLINLFISYCIDAKIEDISMFFFFMQNFNTTMLVYFPESWSLSVEEFAYLFTPFALLISTVLHKPKNKSKWFLFIVLFLIGIFTITKIGYFFTTTNTTLVQWNVSLKAVVIYRIDAILYGILASWIAINYPLLWKEKKNILGLLACFLILIMYVGVGFFRILIETYPFFWNVLYLPFTSIIFLLFLPILSQWKSASRLIAIPITFLSTISYSVYLLHYSVILQVMKHYFPTNTLSITYLHMYTFIYLLITFVLSWVLYQYFEKPIMNLRDKK